jgi:predicted DNA-binding transcriptional regulator AlpA
MGGSLSPDTLATWLHVSVDDALRQWKVACLSSLKSEQVAPIDADEWQDATTVAALQDIVGPQEVAERLGVQVNTVHIWKKRGILPRPARVISGVPLWSTGAIDAWALATGRLELEEIPAF